MGSGDFRTVTRSLLIAIVGLGCWLVGMQVAQAGSPPVDRFTTTWDTTQPGSPSDEIHLPLYDGGTYNFTVDWGDNTATQVVTDYRDGWHKYAQSGTYTVQISGTLTGWSFNNTGDRLKIANLGRWGGVNFGNQGGAFWSAENMQCSASDTPDLTGVTNLSSTFAFAKKFDCPVGDWDVSQVTDMSGMFAFATLFDQDLSGWETSSVTSMNSMFSGAESFNGDVSGWDTSSVTEMNSTFLGALHFDRNLGDWDLRSIASTNEMTYLLNLTGMSTASYSNTLVGWAAQEKLPLEGSGFGLGHVDTHYWCAAAAARAELAKAWTMVMFIDYGLIGGNCFTSTWDTSKTSPGSTSGTQIRLPLYEGGTYDFAVDWGDGKSSLVTSWDDPDAIHDYGTASTATVKISGTLKGWSFSNSGDRLKITGVSDWGNLNFGNKGGAFQGAENLVCTATGSPDLTDVTDLSYTFARASKFNCPLNSWNVSAVATMKGMFSEASAFNQNLDGWDVRKVTDMESMFSMASSFNGDITTWKAESLQNLRNTFFGASDFNRDISGWDTEDVTSMYGTFRDATVFNQPVGSWTTAALTDTSFMFMQARAFNQPLSAWDMSNVARMSMMFRDAVSFNRDVAGWDLGGATTLNSVFYGASAFDQNLGGWDVSHVATMDNLFTDSGMSALNYGKTLIAWSKLNVPTGVETGGRGVKYLCIASGARQSLITNHDWTITDAGATGECFDTTWKTDNPGATSNKQISLPLYVGLDSSYDFWVSWGDGAVEHVTAAAAEHTYATAGTYDVSITGTLRGWRFAKQGDYLKILNVSHWGDVNFGNHGLAFDGAANLTVTATDAPDLQGVTDLTGTFLACTKFNGAVGSWDVSGVKSMRQMFGAAESFNQDLNDWNTSAVMDMWGMFFGATAFNGDIHDWDTSSVVTMRVMFSDDAAFNQDIGDWKTSKVRDMSLMFRFNDHFNQDLSRWDTSSVESMDHMFFGARAFNQDISGWDTSHVTTMGDMFGRASSFDQDLRDWNVAALKDASDMFAGSGVSNLNYSKTLVGWSKQKVLGSVPLGATQKYTCAAAPARQVLLDATWLISDAGQESGNCFTTTWNPWLTGASTDGTIILPLVDDPASRFDFVISWGDGSTEIITSAAAAHTYTGSPQEYVVRISGALTGWAFRDGGDKLKITDVASWGSVNFGNTGGAFEGAGNLSCHATDAPDLQGVTNLASTFSGAAAFDCDVSAWDVSKVEDMHAMFSSASSFNHSLASWDTGEVTAMAGMFRGASVFDQALSGWDTSEVTDMSEMFAEASAFDGSIGAWDTGSVKTMAAMFRAASRFDQDISGWDTAQVTDMSGMFSSAVSFKQPIGVWSTESVTDMQAMFADADSFTQPLDWDTGEVVNMASMFLGAGSFNQDLSTFDIGKVTTMADMLVGSGMSASNYSSTLIGWVGQTPQHGVRLDAQARYNCDARQAHDSLTGTYGWTIKDAGQEPCIAVEPVQVVFGAVQVGESSTSAVRVRNTGMWPLALSGIRVTGQDAARFSVTAPDCGSIMENGFCQLTVTFTPVTPGPVSATLEVESNAVGGPNTAQLLGSGVLAGFRADPVSFGDVRVGSGTNPQNVTVTNTGDGPVAFRAVSVQGEAAGSFLIGADRCSRVTVAPGGTCLVQVSFAPLQPGAQSAFLRFTSNRPEPDAVMLAGTGVQAQAPPKVRQTLAVPLPGHIRRSGRTVIIPANARTNAGLRVTTSMRGGPTRTIVASKTRSFKVRRSQSGRVVVITYGANLRLVVTQKAPATATHTAFHRRAVYVGGRRIR